MELRRKQWFEDTINAKLELIKNYDKQASYAFLTGNSKKLHQLKYFIEWLLTQTENIMKQYKKELGE